MAEGDHLGPSSGQAGGVAPGQHEVRACLCERLGYRATEAATASGDEGTAPVQTEQVQHGHSKEPL